MAKLLYITAHPLDVKSPRLIIIISTIQHLRRTKNGKIIIHYSSSTR